MRLMTWLALVAVLTSCVTLVRASAEDAAPVVLTITDDTFTPTEITVPAGKAFVLKVINKTAAAAEFEAQDLKIEKVMTGDSDITVSVRAMDPGRYLFVNEYKEDTVKGYLIVK